VTCLSWLEGKDDDEVWRSMMDTKKRLVRRLCMGGDVVGGVTVARGEGPKADQRQAG